MKKKFIVKSVIFIFNFCLASYFAFKAFELRSSHEIIQKWPETEATVVSHSIYEQPPAPKTVIRDRWTPVWTYSFNLNNQNIISNSMSFENVSILTFKPSYQLAESTLSQHPVGSKIKIFYNPVNPAETILEKWPLNTSKELLFYAVAGCLLLIGFFVPMILEKDPNKKESA